MLKKSPHYFPIAPSLKWFCHVPWIVFGIYLVTCVLWYTIVMAEDNDEKAKQDTIDKYFDDLVVIGVCLFLLAMMLICVRDFKWVGRLEKR
jgi:4-hydroxybenzoate polyprenyltransferase